MAHCFPLPFPVGIDMGAIKLETQALENDFVKKNGSWEFWQGVPLKNATGQTDWHGLDFSAGIEVSQGVRQCKPTAFLAQCPIIGKLLDQVGEEFGTKVEFVRILKISRGKKLLVHTDGDIFDLDTGSVFRFHLPIQTNPQVSFNIDNQVYHLEEGFLYYLNVAMRHGVVNNHPDQDRIHLVMDLKATPLLRQRLQAIRKAVS